jgi:hypothetical protein
VLAVLLLDVLLGEDIGQAGCGGALDLLGNLAVFLRRRVPRLIPDGHLVELVLQRCAPLRRLLLASSTQPSDVSVQPHRQPAPSVIEVAVTGGSRGLRDGIVKVKTQEVVGEWLRVVNVIRDTRRRPYVVAPVAAASSLGMVAITITGLLRVGRRRLIPFITVCVRALSLWTGSRYWGSRSPRPSPPRCACAIVSCIVAIQVLEHVTLEPALL